MITKRTLYGPIVLIVLVMIPLLGHARSARPESVVETFNAALLESMKSGSALGFSGRYELLAPVIKENFALSFMAEKAVGKFWEGWKPEQQKLFFEKYVRWSVASYANNFDKYSGEKFEVLQDDGKKQRTVTVVSRLTKKNEDTVDFYYKLREIDDRWQIVDIQIKGVSQLALTRAQFVDILKSKGFDELIKVIQEKIETFSGGK